ncbi:hypothetical protein [Sphingomonas panni]|uniref:hypothetical protein n=1 Tax=Sphingomonas panni TaxID=237612 RepID=UPI001F5B2C3A|nr:hypothetical protein [Sphingomonas panni]
MIEDADPSDDAAYLLHLRPMRKSAEVAIVRVRAGCDEGFATQDVWSHPFTDREVARTVYRRLFSRRRHLRWWGRMADLLGARFLDGVLDAEILAASDGPRMAERSSAPRRAGTSRRPPGADVVRMRLVVKDGMGRIEARRAGRRFMVLGARSVEEAVRIWDWVRWQEREYRGWAELVDRDGPFAVATRIMASVLAAERAAHEAGRVADPMRPLRFWRSEHGRYDVGPAGDGPDEVSG